MTQTLTYLRNNLDYGLLIALFIPLLAIMPLLNHSGLPNTADGPVHLMRQVELNQAWAEGNYYPRWGTDLALGHGMPIFSYAPPSLYQLTQLFHLTGLPLDESMKAILIFGFLLYSVGMFLFARRIYGAVPALLAAAIYVYAPYRLREAYIQGNYGQFLGLAFYPLIFWGFHGLITRGRARYWVIAPLALAGLLLSHNISSMIFAPMFAAYLIFLILLDTYQKFQPPPFNLQPFIRLLIPPLLRATGGGLLGLGLAAIFWLPAFGERHDIKLEGITQGFFDFRENFITLPDLLSPPLPLDLSAINPEFPLSLGLPQIIGAAAGIIALLIFITILLARPNISPDSQLKIHNSKCTIDTLAHTIFFTIFLLIYTFLTLPQSQTLWENVPLIELAEFPWRMLGPAVFCASILSAAALSLITRRSSLVTQKKALIIINCSLFIVLALNAFYLYPSQFISWGTPTPADAFAYETASGAIGTTSTGEFLPRWAQQHPQPQTLWPDYEAGQPPQKLDPITLPPGATAQNINHRSESDTIQINTPQAFVATLRTLYWPGWQVYLNDQPTPFTITDDTGLIQVEIPAGQHTLTLALESTPLRTIGLWLTIVVALTIAGIAVYPIIHNRQTSVSRIPNPPSQISHPINLRFFTITAIILISIFLLSRPFSPLFVLQSDPSTPQPADIALQADFADQIRLVGADEWPQEVTLPIEGEADLEVTLYWRAQQKLETNYSVFLHLDAPDGQTMAAIDEDAPENIPTRNWPSGLYLRNLLHLKIPNNLPPIRYNLTAGVYNRETGERLPLGSRNLTAYTLGPVWLIPPQPAVPKPKASFGPDITLHLARLDGSTLELLWQTSQSLAQNYSIFVHVLDPQGNVISQSDGVPYQGLYPPADWLPGQLVQDTRQIDLSGQPANIAIGIYEPATGQRLPAADAQGNTLLNNSYLIAVAQ